MRTIPNQSPWCAPDIFYHDFDQTEHLDLPSIRLPFSPANLDYDIMNEARLFYDFPANMYGEAGDLFQSSTLAPVAPSAEPAVHQAVLANSRPTEFLDIRDTKGSWSSCFSRG